MENKTESSFVEFILYHNWANAQVFAACRELTPEQLAASAPGAYGSIHATLGHLVASEADYVYRLTGSTPQPPFRWEDQPPFDNIQAFSVLVGEALLNAVRRVTPDQIVHEEEDGNTIDYKASLLFMQAVQHGIEHRTNITTILNSAGLLKEEIDCWGYLFSYPGKFALKQTFKGRSDA